MLNAFVGSVMLICLEPSIHDVHTEGERPGSGGCMRMGAGCSAPCGCPHRKLEPTSSCLSSRVKKLAFLCTIILSLEGIKRENFSLI